MSNPTSTATPRLPLKLCLAFGLGTNGTATLLGVTGVYLLFFMTTMLGIEPALAGTLIFLSKIYDLVTDPFMGHLSDRTRTRLGRRRPWLLVGAVVAGGAAWLLFDVPQIEDPTWRVTYYTLILLLFASGYTLFSVPYLSMPAEMTTDYHERTRLMSFRTFFGSTGLLIGTAIAPILVTAGSRSSERMSEFTVLQPADGSDCVMPVGGGAQMMGTEDGYAFMGMMMALIVFSSMALAFWGTAGARFNQPANESSGFLAQLRYPLRNRPFMLLVATKTLQLTGVTAFSAGLAFYARYVVQLSDAQLGMFFGMFSLGTIISLPAWVKIARVVGKKHAYFAAVIVFSILDVLLLFISSGALGPLLGLATLLGMSAGGLILLGVSMLPDTIDHDFYTTGVRREGIYAGVWSTIEKGSAAIATLFAGAILSMAGFIETQAGEVACQPTAVLDAIQLNVAILPAGLMLLSLLFLSRYDLSQERLAALAGGGIGADRNG